ncbi:hypothetical protein BGZ76_010092 [Entomortierella beljakovae]|nr:hypothetical protein BGZ76_010092 [Entomortierella beljakovae]
MFDQIPPANLLKIYKGCSNCRTQKIKCSGQEPCARCRAFGLQCHYIVLPNQPAHRIALAVSTQEPPLIQIYTAPTIQSAAPNRLWQTQPPKKIKLDSKGTTNPRSHEHSRSSSPTSSRSTSEPSDSPTTSHSSTFPSGPHNAILQSISDVVDTDSLDQKEIPDSKTLGITSELLRRLITLYMRYVHPLFRIVSESDPIFWNRLDDPIPPEFSSLVYAMCTIGAMLKSKTPSDGQLDDHVFYFYRKTRSVIESRPKDFVTLQSLLIIQSLHVVAHQRVKYEEDYQLMSEIADSIQLGEMVKKIVFHTRLSQEDLVLRNTWRMLIWIDTLANMVATRNYTVDPQRELSSPGLDSRAEEIPGTKSTSSEAAYFYFAGLFKIFQYISKIRSPLSPRDLHPVTSALDTLCLWHNSLPKNLRCNSKPGETGSVSSHATNLDLFYRLGHILLLNLLPPSVRSSPTGLGPRRESPLRILATCANGITSAMGDLIKEPDLKSYCMAHGMRCLTEAAMIQMQNSKEPDPAISTPAKVNFMKTLWCIKQFNFAIPPEVLLSVLEPYNTLMKQATSIQRTDREGRRVGGSRTRTPSSAESQIHDGREHSLASDYSSSTGSTREGSHMTVFESEEIDRERQYQSPTSPTQDSTTSLMTLSLESPTVTQRGFIMEPSSGHQVMESRLTLLIPKVEEYGNDKPISSSSSPSATFLSPKAEHSNDELHLETSTGYGPIRENKNEYPSDSGLRSRGSLNSGHSDRSLPNRRPGPGDQYYKEHDGYLVGSKSIEESRPPDGENSNISRQPLKRSVSQTQNLEDSGVILSPMVRESRGPNQDYSGHGSYLPRRAQVSSPDGAHSQHRHHSHSGRAYDSMPQDYFSIQRQDGQINVISRAGPQPLHVSMNYQGHRASPHEKSPRTPLSANSDISLRDRYDDTDLDTQELKYSGGSRGRSTFIVHESQLGNRPNAGGMYIRQQQELSGTEERGKGGYINSTVVEHDKNSVITLDSGESSTKTRTSVRKRPSVSMYGREEAMFGAIRNGKADNTCDMRDGGEVKQFPVAGALYADPLHQDGAEAARLRGLKRDNYDRQTRQEYGPNNFNGTSIPGQSMISPSQTGHDLPLHHTAPSSIHHPQPQPQQQQHTHRTQQQQQQQLQHYSYQRIGPSSSPSHRQMNNYDNQDGQQHEPRTSPGSITPLSSLSPSHPPEYPVGDSYVVSRPSSHTRRYSERTLQHQIQDQHYDQGQYWRQESELYDQYQRHETSRGLMGPPPVPLERTGNDFGGTYNNDDDLATGIVEVLRDPIRRKYR